MKLTLEQVHGIALYAGRRDFWSFCQLRAPKFYKRERAYLVALCKTLQELVESPTMHRLIINMPPRHGKTRTVTNLCQWFLGRYHDKAIMTASYNETLSSRMAKAVRDGIAEKKASPERLVYSDYFPTARIKEGDGASQLWALEGSHFSFLATSPGGTATGMGAHLLIIDDLVKNAYEAFNERILEEHWDWYTSTILSRLEKGAKQIIIQTRWSMRDLTARLLEQDPGKWHVVSMPAYNETTGEMLAPDILTLEDYRDRESKTDPMIFQANYQQKPFDSVDRLYSEFRTYNPGTEPKFQRVESYTDTADKGSDFLASAVYGVVGNQAYILDLEYTQDSMERTEPQVALMLQRHKCGKAWIEANNGGEGFSRAVKDRCQQDGFTSCVFQTFHQTANKESRILTNATTVTNSILMPADWKTRWPKFYQDITRMGRAGKWSHDDGADMLTGIVEKSINTNSYKLL